MANQYDTNLKLQAIADAIGNTSSSGLISALEDIADAVAGGGGGGSSTAGLVSDNFSETDTYDLGDYCIHNNTLYVCINAITTPGPWDLSDWQATNAGLELSSLNSALTVNIIGSATTMSSTPYVFPSDGYIICSARGTDGFSAAEIKDANGVLFASPSIAGTSMANTFQIATYVKKGMSAIGAKAGSSSANNVTFVPLTTN